MPGAWVVSYGFDDVAHTLEDDGRSIDFDSRWREHLVLVQLHHDIRIVVLIPKTNHLANPTIT